jgi:Ca2+-binding EF-hand superfamily protein
MPKAPWLLLAALVVSACAEARETSECKRIIKQGRMLFDRYDTDHDGRISRQEYQPIIDVEREFAARQAAEKRSFYNPSDFDADFAYKDQNGDGYLDFEEFIGGLCKNGHLDRSPPALREE